MNENPTLPPPKKEKLERIISLKPSQVINKKRVLWDFEDKWLQAFNRPERTAKWFITGPSYSGKSTFLFELCAMLCRFGKVSYNSHEEGDSATVGNKLKQFGLEENEDKFRLIHKAPIDLYLKHLERKGSAQFVVVDSLQHADMNKYTYLDFTKRMERKGKTQMFVSHWVKNDLTKFVKHDCDVKIEVVGFVAHIECRYGGNKPIVIWEQGAKAYWGKKYTNVIAGRYWPGQKK